MKNLRRAGLRLIASLALLGGAAEVSASELTIPNSFTAGSRASAAQVNQNFQATATAVNDNDANINDATTRVTTLESTVGSQETRLTAVEQSVAALAGAVTVPVMSDAAGQIVGALVPWQSSFAASFPGVQAELRLAAMYVMGQQRVKVLFGRNTAGDGLQIVDIYASALAFTLPNCTGDAYYQAGTEQNRYEYEGYDETVVVRPFGDSAQIAHVDWTPIPAPVVVQSSVDSEGVCSNFGLLVLGGVFAVTVEPFPFNRPFTVR
jgi:hypothetical protein